jgi:cell division transport system permease protein
MKIRTFKYLVGEGGRGLHRHSGLTFTAILTMTASLLVLGVFLVTTYNVRRVIEGLEGRKEVAVYLKEGISVEDRALFEERLNMHPAVAGARYVPKEEAWEEFSQSMNVKGLRETVGDNPLPDGYRLVLQPTSRDAATIAGLSAELGTWDEVVVVIVASTVRLTVVARQDLIHIMKSVGASEAFIRLPFLSEGAMQALFAAVVALGALFGATYLVSQRVADVEFLSLAWCGGFLGLALGLGLMGSLLSVRHVLRQVGL